MIRVIAVDLGAWFRMNSVPITREFYSHSRLLSTYHEFEGIFLKGLGPVLDLVQFKLKLIAMLGGAQTQAITIFSRIIFATL